MAWCIFALDTGIRIWMCSRVVLRRLPAGVAWAWISLILFLPLVATILYLFFGEYRQATRRVLRLEKAKRVLAMMAAQHKQTGSRFEGEYADFSRAYELMIGLPAQGGNDIELLPNADRAFERLALDIDNAQRSIDLEFYIWSDGGRADLFGQSLVRAAGRGVKIRLLVDAIGSAGFIKGGMLKSLRAAGIDVVIALPSGFWRSLFARPDLRIHRKIIVIDGEIAYSGSMNLADPKFFKMDSGAGPWVDALARITGPAVAPLASVFLSDWCAETGLDFAAEVAAAPIKDIASKKTAAIQCLPSGPAVKHSEIEQALLMAVAEAQKLLVLTTPYFLPSEAMLYVLIAAARRGVQVTLIVPEKVDSHLTQLASRSFFEDLLEAGVEIYLFQKGLLHTKSVVVDGRFSLFGTLNLDPRSLRINFEVTQAIYDRGFTEDLLRLQRAYLENSVRYDLESFNSRSSREVWAADLARLVGPLL